jgi:hypothetical protein
MTKLFSANSPVRQVVNDGSRGGDDIGAINRQLAGIAGGLPDLG